MARPVVGVVSHRLVVARPFGDLPVTGTPQAYVTALSVAGFRPVLLPGEHALAALDLVDALVLTGGGDIDPALSGAGQAVGVDRGRDAAEIAVARAAGDRRLPLLGCCRGMQVMAVAFAGSLRSVADHVRPGPGHAVRTRRGSLVADLIGPDARTTALHEQAVADTGPFWQATAWADGVVEAIEPSDDPWPALGVQWHPELHGIEPFVDDTGPALFRWLAAASAGTAAAAPPERTAL
jgi:putative glutamine amidotransferase